MLALPPIMSGVHPIFCVNIKKYHRDGDYIIHWDPKERIATKLKMWGTKEHKLFLIWRSNGGTNYWRGYMGYEKWTHWFSNMGDILLMTQNVVMLKQEIEVASRPP